MPELTFAYELTGDLVIEIGAKGEINLVVVETGERTRVTLDALSCVLDVLDDDSQNKRKCLDHSWFPRLTLMGAIRSVANGTNSTQTRVCDLSITEQACLRLAQKGGLISGTIPVKKNRHRHADADVQCVIPMSRPDSKTERSFEEVCMSRRSVREPTKSGLTHLTLSYLLYYSCKVQLSGHDSFGETVRKCSASGGAKHPVVIYMALRNLQGIPDGFYAYNDYSHSLLAIDLDSEMAERLCSLASSRTGQRVSVCSVALFGFADIGPVAAKYTDTALSILWKDFGCLTQQFYLVGASQDLACCAIGGIPKRKLMKLAPSCVKHLEFLGAFILW